MEYECITKFRDKNNRIKGYRLRDKNGRTVEESAEKVKKAIACGNVTVSNLTLTSDGRLVDTGAGGERKTKSIFRNVDEAARFIILMAGTISRAAGWTGNLHTEDNGSNDKVDLNFEPKNGNFVYKKEYVYLNITWCKETNKLSVSLQLVGNRIHSYEEKSVDAVDKVQLKQFMDEYASCIKGKLEPQI